MQVNNRYQRQIQLKEFGISGQKKLSNSKVLVIGAGGLGCPCLLYLAAAGIGKIGIVDYDFIEVSNLHRQILFGQNDIGKAKAQTAAQKLKEQYPDVNIEFYHLKLSNQNSLDILENYDLVIDGSDNYETRYMLNDACLLLKKPYILGCVYKYEGQVGIFDLSGDGDENISYRDFHIEPPINQSDSCEEAGVIGVLPGIIGCMQAAEAIKIISNIGEPLRGKIISYNLKRNTFYEFSISLNPEKNIKAPKSINEFKKYNYEVFCGIQKDCEIDWNQLKNKFSDSSITLIDIRDLPDSAPNFLDPIIHIPFSELKTNAERILNHSKILIFCNSGKTSLKAVEYLKSLDPTKEIYSLKNGIKGIS